MAKAKQNAVAEEQPEASQEAPAKTSVSTMTPAQEYKLKTLKAKADAEAAKRESVLAKVKEEAASYKPELRGSWIGYTEKNKAVSPALVIAERFEGEGDALKLILTLYVFSPTTAQPYRAELTY